MKNLFLAMAIAVAAISCGNANNHDNTTEQGTSDSTNGTNMNASSQTPAGDTGNQVNNRAGSYPADTSNQNGNDSVKGTSRTSRSTTPGNGGGKGGRKQ
jgi:hypothetical protein